MPANSTVSPAPMSVPANDTAAPGTAACRTTTRSPSMSVCSTGTTASAPRGSMPPVPIGDAWPRPTSRCGATPVGIDSPVSSSRTGSSSTAPKVSPARTAKPSRLARSKPGTSISARTSAASTRPRARSSGTVSTPSGAASIAAHQRRSASSRSRTSRN